jgi:hypothetical protein
VTSSTFELAAVEFLGPNTCGRKPQGRTKRDMLMHLLSGFNGSRACSSPRISMSKEAPVPRAVQAVRPILPTPTLGRLHDQYVRI